MQNSSLERKTFTFSFILPKKWRKWSDNIEYIEIQQASIAQTMEYLRRKAEGNDEVLMIILELEKRRKKKFSKKEREYLIAN